MMLPFFHSLRSILERRLGDLVNLIPQGLFAELEKYHVVDAEGVLVWSLGFLLLGMAIGYLTRGYTRR
jgi:hypothetical protein